ncbi:Ig domain-containing protein [Deinococcus apachensis]|uniref:Ig domain-containing protein n=1 Tax=Deinococcus apachensis TaxID=309886 RepID=UPI0003A8D1ED|nr:Ig domain-containing protein [Deinococcus apachensis]
MRQANPAWALLACGVLLVSCGSSTNSTTGTTSTSTSDPLYFTTTSLPVGYVAESYDTPIAVAGGSGPYGVRVASGTLPPGVTLRNQRLAGTPTKLGTYTFTLEASDANLSSKVQSYTLNVNELPPLALKPQLPAAEIRGETRIPLNITAPRSARAARMVWDLPEGVRVTRVQPAESGGVLFWKQAGRTVTVDVGFKTIPRNGARVALLSVKPSKVTTLDTNRFAFQARDGEGKLLAEVKMPDAPKPATAPTTPSTAPATTPATPTTTPTTPGSDTTTPGTPDIPVTPPSPQPPSEGGDS